ncbi:MAG: sodium:solute symporter family protein, partial [Bacillota bacterium]|nr:sodium:solute symporter family protein [Bacillota bacterium]
KKIFNSKDFNLGGRKFSSTQVAASIVGTLVGGASTIGTSQAAFVSGINGLWFTLGASFGCLFLGAFLSNPLRNAEIQTIPEFMTNYYGSKSRVTSSLISSIAIFIHITGQVLASVAIITSLFSINENTAVFITILLIISYIFFGGFFGSSLVGSIKTILLYITLTYAGIFVINRFSGFHGYVKSFSRDPWFNLFSDGLFNGLAMGFSLVVGVSSTQTYLQAIFSGKNASESRKGAFLSALLIPPIGILSTLIGMFMKVNHPNIMSKQALPLFVLEYLNPLIGGVVIATLIISVVATGAGLTLGISTMISRDIYPFFTKSKLNDSKELFINRLAVLIISIFVTLMVFFNLDSLILKWAFLSMTLRGTVIFTPLIFALILKDKTPKNIGYASMIISPSLIIILSLLNITYVAPLYIGLGI